MSFKTIALAAVAAAVIASPAAAVIANGSFSAAIGNPASSLFGIQAGTVITNTGGVVTSSVGDFLPVPFLTTFTVNPFTATNGSVFSFTSSFGNFSGMIQSLTTAGPPTAEVNFDVFGTFTPLGILAGFTPGAASASFGLTQTGGLTPGDPQPAISGGFSFSTPPTVQNEVPEPAAWAMLIAGFGLTGAVMRRRRGAVAA